MRYILITGILFLLFFGCKKEKPNTAPTAFFTVSPEIGTIDTTFTFNASASGDKEDVLEGIEIRWDFQGDNIWDTEYSSDKIINHKYSEAGKYSVFLEVMDSEGLLDTISRQLEVFADSVFPDPEILLLYPSSHEIITDTIVSLIWSGNMAMEYKIISNLENTSPLIVLGNTSDTSIQVSYPKRNSEIYWRISGTNEYGLSYETDTDTFFISHNIEDQIVFLNPNPADLSMSFSSDSIKLSCDVVHNYDGPVHYFLETGHSPDQLEKLAESLSPNFEYIGSDYRSEAYWRIIVDNGEKTINGPVWHFRMKSIDGPYVPYDPSPQVGEVVKSNKVVLSWKSGLRDADQFWQVVYKVYVGQSPDDLKMISEQKERDYLFKDLLSGQTFYWRVDASYRNYVTVGDVWMFKTERSLIPLRAFNTNPKPGSVLYTIPETWTWEVDNPDGESLTYDVYFGEYPDLDLIHRSISKAEIPAPQGFEPDEHYQWRVDVIDESGEKTVGKPIFLHTPASRKLQRINHFRSDTIYDIRVFEYDDMGRMISNILDSYSYYYYEYIWIRMDSVVYDYDEFNRVNKIVSRERWTGSNGWFKYDKSYSINHIWDNDTLCYRKNNEGDIQDIFVYDASGRNVFLYHNSFLIWTEEDATPHMNAEYGDGYLPEKITYIHYPNYSGSFVDVWQQDMQYDGHPNPYFQIPFLRKYQLDRRTKFAPTEFAENTVTIDRSRRYGTDHIVFKYEYDPNGYVSKKWVEGNKDVEYWEFLYE